MRCLVLFILLLLLVSSTTYSQSLDTSDAFFGNYLSADFDYSQFMCFESPEPPLNSIYQSNGYMALLERGFAAQSIIIPAPVDDPPHNTGDRLSALEIEAPIFIDSSNHTYSVTESEAQRHVEYYPD